MPEPAGSRLPANASSRRPTGTRASLRTRKRRVRRTFKAPTALSDYTFSARGVTGSDTLVGQTTAELVVRKDFFVDIKVPPSLTQGDKPRFIGQIHRRRHQGDRNEVKPLPTRARMSRFIPRSSKSRAMVSTGSFFEPVPEVPDSDNGRLTLSTATVRPRRRMSLSRKVPVRGRVGVQGSARRRAPPATTPRCSLGQPAGRTYREPRNARGCFSDTPASTPDSSSRAIGRDCFVLLVKPIGCSPGIFPPPPTATGRPRLGLARRDFRPHVPGASTRGGRVPAAARRSVSADREDPARLVTELTAVQNEDGGWPVGGGRWSAERGTAAGRRARTSAAGRARAPPRRAGLGLLTDAGRRSTRPLATSPSSSQSRRGRPRYARRLAPRPQHARRGELRDRGNSLNRLRQSPLRLLGTRVPGADCSPNLDRKPLAGRGSQISSPPPRRTEVGGAFGDKPRRSGPAVASPRHPRQPRRNDRARRARLRPVALHQASPSLTARSTGCSPTAQGFGWTPHQAKGAGGSPWPGPLLRRRPDRPRTASTWS